MNNPFKKDDVVYHASHGKGVVLTPDAPDNVNGNFRTVLVLFEDSKINGRALYHLSAPSELSFKPWPKAEHERPVCDGWWFAQYSDNPVQLRQKRGEDVYDSTGWRVGTAKYYTFIQYIGKEWKK